MTTSIEIYRENREILRSLASDIKMWKGRRKQDKREGYSLDTIESNIRGMSEKYRTIHIAQSLWRAFIKGEITAHEASATCAMTQETAIKLGIESKNTVKEFPCYGAAKLFETLHTAYLAAEKAA